MDIVDKEYERDSGLRREDVKQLLDWLETQPHLPKMTEHEVIWFLSTCHHNNELTKTRIDNFYTIRTQEHGIFRQRNEKELKFSFDTAIMYILPDKTPNGQSIFWLYHRLQEPTAYIFTEQIKMFDTMIALGNKINGTNNGFQFVIDIQHSLLGHLVRMEPMLIKKMLVYLTKAMPVRTKGIHILHTKPFIQILANIVKPLFKQEIYDKVQYHNTIDDLAKVLPLEALPSDYGGKGDSLQVLEKKMWNLLMDNENFLERIANQVVDESKRPKESKRFTSEFFGIDGTFKKLQID